MAKKKSNQFKVWACILYPESLKPNFKQIIQETHVACALSPLHDKDVHEDGTLKKAHYHCMIKFDTYRRQETAQAFFDLLGEVPRCTFVFSEYGYYHYLWHDDNDKKVEYSKDDIELFSNYQEPYQEKDISKQEVRGMKLLELYKFINDENIKSYHELMMVLGNYAMYEEIDVATQRAYALTQYIKSRCKKDDEIKKQKANIEYPFRPAPDGFDFDDDSFTRG